METNPDNVKALRILGVGRAGPLLCEVVPSMAFSPVMQGVFPVVGLFTSSNLAPARVNQLGNEHNGPR